LHRIGPRRRFTPAAICGNISREINTVAKKPKKRDAFDIQEFLSFAGTLRSIAKFKKGQVIFSQDDPCDDVLYIQSGNAKLTIVNPQGKEAVLAIVGPGDFLGEGRIIGNPVRMATATAIAPLNAMSIEKKEMMRVLHDEPEFAGKFLITCWSAT
jgi:CRP/FNR family transcriptional regulator, cyclic AMP receptor protein